MPPEIPLQKMLFNNAEQRGDNEPDPEKRRQKRMAYDSTTRKIVQHNARATASYVIWNLEQLILDQTQPATVRILASELILQYAYGRPPEVPLSDWPSDEMIEERAKKKLFPSLVLYKAPLRTKAEAERKVAEYTDTVQAMCRWIDSTEHELEVKRRKWQEAATILGKMQALVDEMEPDDWDEPGQPGSRGEVWHGMSEYECRRQARFLREGRDRDGNRPGEYAFNPDNPPFLPNYVRHWWEQGLDCEGKRYDDGRYAFIEEGSGISLTPPAMPELETV